MRVNLSAGSPAELVSRLAAGQRDRGASELAIGPDHDGLLVTARRECEVRGKSRGSRYHLKDATTGTSLDIPVDITAGFGPSPRDGGALRREVAGQVELVAVAGAGQGLLHAISARTNSVSSAAANPLGRAVVQRDRARAGPHAGQTGKWPGSLRMACSGPHRGGQKGAKRER